MKNIQGGILSVKNTRGNRAALLMFRFKHASEGDEKGNTRTVQAAAGLVTDALKQYGLYHNQKSRRPIFRSFMLTASGLSACGVTRDDVPGNFFPTIPRFREMRRDDVTMMLGDRGIDEPKLKSWEKKYLRRIDGAWLLAHDEPKQLDEAVSAMRKWCGKRGLAVMAVERGAASKTEAFGFKDGISMQRFFSVSPSGTLDTKLEQIFLQGPQDWGSSIMAFRKLEQDVKAFHAFETTRGTKAVEAMIGRKKDGSPLVGTRAGALNDFDFSGDPRGAVCPFHAHIRRMNPRDGLAAAQTSLRMVRRGLVYGGKGSSTPKKTGLLFMAYMHDPVTFEIMQADWAKNGGNDSDPEPDPLLFGPPPGECPASKRWVRPRGGAYFFVPSLNWMRAVRPNAGAS